MLFCLVTGKISHSNTMFWVLYLYAFTAKIISHLGLNIKTRVFYKIKYLSGSLWEKRAITPDRVSNFSDIFSDYDSP